MAVATAVQSRPARSNSASAPALERRSSRGVMPRLVTMAQPPVHTLQQSPSGSGRIYTTRDGKVIELPAEMTFEKAARLEAEAIAAAAKLGKGPPPRPVPEVKKLVKKEEK